MAFCTVEDLKTRIKPEELDAITRLDETISLDAISTVIAEAKGYLKAYDTETLFSAEGEARDPLLLSQIKAMAIYEALALSPENQDIEDRENRARIARNYLKAVSKGELSPDWPKLETESQQSGQISYGSNRKRGTHY